MDIQAQNIDVEVDYVDEETLRQQQEEDAAVWPFAFQDA